MRQSIRTLLTGTLLMTAGIGSTSAVTIKLGSLAPSGSPWDDGIRTIAARWEEISDGKVVLKTYAGGIAGGEEDMIRKMRIGQLGAAGMTGIGMCRIFPGILALQLPLLTRTDEELDYVLEKMKPRFEKELEQKGFTVLVWSKVGWVHFFSRQPVVKPGDLKDQKLFVYAGDPDGVKAWRDAGFHTVPLEPSDLMSSLQSGMVEAFTTTPLSAAAYQWFGLAKNMCGMQWAPMIGGIVVSNRVWNRVPKELRPKLEQAAEEIGRQMQAKIDTADEQAIAVMKEHGLEISEVSEKDIALWEAEVRTGFDKLVGKSFDKESFELVKKYLQEFRAQ